MFFASRRTISWSSRWKRPMKTHPRCAITILMSSAIYVTSLLRGYDLHLEGSRRCPGAPSTGSVLITCQLPVESSAPTSDWTRNTYAGVRMVRSAPSPRRVGRSEQVRGRVGVTSSLRRVAVMSSSAHRPSQSLSYCWHRSQIPNLGIVLIATPLRETLPRPQAECSGPREGGSGGTSARSPS
jgi:hypothetical protein